MDLISREVPTAPPGLSPELAQWLWDVLNNHYRDLLALANRTTVGNALEFIATESEQGDDGNWRFIIDGDDFKVQKRISGTWETSKTYLG